MPPSSTIRDIGNGAALEAERKLISVLFADVHRSTAMIGSLDPEDALAHLEPILAAMARAVHRYDGIVSKEAGDGIMAVFGAPVAVDDHAERACFAALAIHDEIKTLDAADLQVRVGIHSGEVVIRTVTVDFSSVYDAAGAVVHIAQKLEAGAPLGGTLISQDCARLARNRFALRPGAIPKTVSADLMAEVFELVAARPVTRWEGRASEGLSRFVGREAFLRQLRAQAEAAATGDSRVVVIEGEPGNGKSRLAHEFLDWARVRDWAIWEVAAESSARLPWITARGLLSAAFGTPRGQPAAVARRIAFETSGLTDEERDALFSLFGLPVTAAAWRDIDPEYRRHLTFTAMTRALSHAISAAKSPIAVLVEDQHWLDAESDESLNRLVAAIAGRPVLILVTRRPYHNRPLALADAALLSLGSLSTHETSTLLGGLLGEHPSLEPLKQRIAAHTGGVPLFIEEVVRRLIDTGVLAKIGGGYRLNAAVDALGIPPTVQAVIAGRIDRLPRDVRAVLQTAAVLGQRIAIEHLRAVLGEDARSLDDALRLLHDASLLLVAASFGVEELRFAHDLIHEVAYSGILRNRRRELHGRALAALASLYGAEAEQHAEQLYRHAAAAGEWALSLQYARIAGAQAIEQSAYRNAGDFFEAALTALKQLEPTRAHAELEIDLRLEARLAFGATAQLAKLLAHAREAEAIALSIGDARRAIAAATQKAAALTFLGVPEDAIAAGDAVLQAALAANASELELVARYILGQAHFTAGNFGATADLMAKARAALADKPLTRMGTTGTTLVLVHAMEAVSLASLGDVADARRTAAAAREIAGSTGRPYDEATAAYAASFAALLAEEVDETIAIAKPAIETIRTRAITFFFPLVANQLGQAYGATGRLKESLEILREALTMAEQLGHVASRVTVQISLGQTLSRLGRWREAEEILNRSLETARQQGFKALHSISARLLAAARARLGAAEEQAEALLLAAIEAGDACEARPHVARARLALAESYLRSGRSEQALDELDQAIAAFRDMRMNASLGRAEELSRQAGFAL